MNRLKLIGIEKAPNPNLAIMSDENGNTVWKEVASSGGGVGEHAELPDLLPEGIAGDEANHITDAQLEFIKDYVERRPVRPTNLSPVDLEAEVGERARFESTPYLHPFNLVMAGYQLVVKHGETIVYDSGDLDMISVIFKIPADVLQENTDYTWQVRYKGSNLQWSEWSNPTQFKTQVVFGEQEIDQPNLLLPTQGALLNDPFAMGVTTPFDPTGGLIQAPGLFEVATSPEFDTIVDSGRGLNVWFGSVELTRGQNYFMRAQHEATTGEKSKKSPIRTFSVRKLYRGQRIGVVLVDPATWTYHRIGDDYKRVYVDDGYWLNNGVWGGLEASRNNGANTLIDGQEMMILPAFSVLSGLVPYGPYAGMKALMMDPTTPSQEDIDAGWHMYDGFLSPSGWVDSISFSAYRVSSNAGVAESKRGATAIKGYASAIIAAIKARNTDKNNPLKRGWHPTDYLKFGALHIMRLVEFASLAIIRQKMAEPFHGFNLFTADGLLSYGITTTRRLIPGTEADFMDNNPPLAPSHSLLQADDFYPGDYMLPYTSRNANFDNGAAPYMGINGYNRTGSKYMSSGSGVFGLDSSADTPSGEAWSITGMMSKWP